MAHFILPTFIITPTSPLHHHTYPTSSHITTHIPYITTHIPYITTHIPYITTYITTHIPHHHASNYTSPHTHNNTLHHTALVWPAFLGTAFFTVRNVSLWHGLCSGLCDVCVQCVLCDVRAMCVLCVVYAMYVLCDVYTMCFWIFLSLYSSLHIWRHPPDVHSMH